MFIHLLRFECTYQMKRWAFVGFGLIFLAFGLLQGSQGYAPALVDVNSPFQIFYNIGLTTIGCEFVIMFFVVSGLLRDRMYQMESILYSTAIPKRDFWLSRFLGVLLFSLAAFSTCLLGFAIGTLFPGVDPDRLAAFEMQSYVRVWCIMVLPNVLICSAILFSIAAWTKNQIATYVSAILIYFLYVFCSMYFNSPLMARSVPADPENLIYAALADPFGLAAFFEQTQFWTPFQKNNQMISLTGNVLWNRLIWLGFSTLLLAFSYHFFSFRQSTRKTKKKESLDMEILSTSKKIPIPNLQFGTRFHWKSFQALFRLDCSIVFKSLPFLGILLVWLLISFINIYERIYQGGAYHDSLYPTSNLLIELTRDPILSRLLIVFFSGELMWKARERQFHHILDTTAVSNGMMLLSKVLCLLMIPLLINVSSAMVCIGFQVLNDSVQVEIWQYVNTFYFSGMRDFFYIFLALFIQKLVSNKYLGMVITALTIALLGTTLAGYIGIEHPLLILGRLPYVGYTNMNGYDGNTTAFYHFLLYWGALGLILGMLAGKLWQRGHLDPVRIRLRALGSKWNRWEKLGLLGLSLLFLGTASLIFVQTNREVEYRTVKEHLDERERYERTYKSYDALDKLTVIAIKTNVDVYPDKGRYKVQAEYELQNRTDHPIQQVFLTERMPLTSAALQKAHQVFRDSLSHTRLFEFHSPLQAGETTSLNFDLTYERKGFETSEQLVSNGSYIMQHDVQPMLGYRKSLEIKDEFERKKRGLPERDEEQVNDAHIHHHQYHRVVPILFESTISTAIDQIALAPGDLIEEWEEGERRYFRYRAADRIMESIQYFSANYEMQIRDYAGVSIEQYYHPGHDYNIDQTEKFAQLTLDYCSENFGSYPFNHLRIAEIPGHWGFGGQAMPGTISMVEDRFYLLDNRDPDGFDLVAKRTIHEVAHQWWGMLLRPKIIEGGSFLLEGLAKYTEAVVMEQHFGKRAVWQLSESANQRYFSGRAFATEHEPALAYTDGENYLAYGKSFVVMLALKELLGEEIVNGVLRKMVATHRDEMEPTATSLEFLEELYSVSAPEYHSLINDWFKRVMTYDLSVKNLDVQMLNNGTYAITASILAHRSEMQTDGSMSPTSIDEPILLGLFSCHPKEVDSSSSILYLQPEHISQERTDIRIVVNELPRYIAIDPFGARVEENRLDNVQQIE